MQLTIDRKLLLAMSLSLSSIAAHCEIVQATGTGQTRAEACSYALAQADFRVPSYATATEKKCECEQASQSKDEKIYKSMKWSCMAFVSYKR